MEELKYLEKIKKMKNKKIIIDTLGADMPPTEICEGIKLNNNKNYHYVVVGPKEEIQKVIDSKKHRIVEIENEFIKDR